MSPAFANVVTSRYNVVTMTEVSVRELKAKLTEYLRRAEAGEQIGVTRRGKVIASLGPSSNGGSTRPKTLDEKLQLLRERGVLYGSGKPFKPSGKPVKLIGEGPTVSEMIIEDRGPR